MAKPASQRFWQTINELISDRWNRVDEPKTITITNHYPQPGPYRPRRRRDGVPVIQFYEPVAEYPPPQQAKSGQGRRRLETESVCEWLVTNPASWCRVVGPDDAPITHDDLNALKGNIKNTAFRVMMELKGPHNQFDVTFTTRRRSAGFDLYAQLLPYACRCNDCTT